MAAPTVTQTVKHAVDTGTGGTLNGLITYSAGRLAVAGLTNFGGSGGQETGLTISDNVHGAYTVIARRHGGAGANAGMFYKENLSAGSVNVTWASTSGGVTLFLAEVQDALTASSLIGSNNNASTAQTLHDSLNVDNTGKVNALYMAVISIDLGGTVTINLNQTGTEGTWAEFNAASRETNGAVNMAGSIVNQSVTTAQSRGHVWGTISADTAMVIAAFEGTSGTNLSGAIVGSVGARSQSAGVKAEGQVAQPTSDISVGAWTTQTGATTNLFAVVDEVIADDADYIRSEQDPNSSPVTLAFESLDAPISGTRTLRYRYWKDISGAQVDLVVDLMEGASVVQTWTHNDITTIPTLAEQTITNAISDYSNLRIRFTANQV